MKLRILVWSDCGEWQQFGWGYFDNVKDADAMLLHYYRVYPDRVFCIRSAR